MALYTTKQHESMGYVAQEFYPSQMADPSKLKQQQQVGTNPSSLSHIHDSGKVRLTTGCSVWTAAAGAAAARDVAAKGLAEVIITPAGTGLALNW